VYNYNSLDSAHLKHLKLSSNITHSYVFFTFKNIYRYVIGKSKKWEQVYLFVLNNCVLWSQVQLFYFQCFFHP
jgi:hypothetical protein